MIKKSDKNFLRTHEKNIRQADHWILGEFDEEQILPNMFSQAEYKKWADNNMTTNYVSALSLEEQSEQQFIHALLIQQYEPDKSCYAYVDRGMERLAQCDQAESAPSRLTIRVPSFGVFSGVAASFALCVLIVFFAYPTTSAMAAFDQVMGQFNAGGDRLYQVRVKKVKRGGKQRLTPSSEDKPAIAAKGNKRKGKENSTRFDRAALYMRGTDQFVLMEYRDDGAGFIKGSNGIDSWRVNSKGKGTVVGTKGEIKLPLASNARNMVFLDIAQSLEKLKEGYTISLLENQALKGQQGLWSKIVAEKADHEQKGVKRVLMYFDPQNYEIQKLVFDRAHLSGSRDLVKISLDLQSTEPLPEDFFDVSMHAGAATTFPSFEE